MLHRRSALLGYAAHSEAVFEKTAELFSADSAAFLARSREVRGHLDNIFAFAERVFGKDRELLIILTEVAANPNTARFIGLYGCDAYYRYDRELMFHERRLEIIDELNRMHSDGSSAY